MKVFAVIPARYNSSRFHGKALAEIDGVSIVVRTAKSAQKCLLIDEVWVATDDPKIRDNCRDNNINVVMTSKDHKTGTDRLTEAASILSQDDNNACFINVQGDEPFIEPDVIDKVAKSVLDGNRVVSAMSVIDNKEDLDSPNVTKVVCDKEGYALMISRSVIPFVKQGCETPVRYRQLGVFGFHRAALFQFNNLSQGPIEKAESIEFLRFLESKIPVKMVCVETNSIAVDTPDDLQKAIRAYSLNIIKEENIIDRKQKKYGMKSSG